MSKYQYLCPVCSGPTKRSGTTSAKTPRWRCKVCGFSWTRSNNDARQAYWFKVFIDWLLQPAPLTQVAAAHHISRRILVRYFEPFWLVTVPVPHEPERIYDQLFIDGTYFNKNCLLIASTSTHVTSWVWGFTESAWLYNKLFDTVGPPLVVTTDGAHGALKAIQQTWPTSTIQRCLIHVQRTIFTYTTKRPQTTAGNPLKRLAVKCPRFSSV